jgi:hypothetical protein
VGAFVGLVIAMIARGDANGVLDATAGLIDPSHATAPKAAAAAAPVRFTVQPQSLDTAPKPMPAGSEGSTNAGACSTVNEPVTPTVAPIVISAASHATPAAIKTPVEPSTPRASAPAVAAAAHASPKPGAGYGASAHEAGASPSRAAKSSKSAPADFESAAAADALAKAQLEASLR